MISHSTLILILTIALIATGVISMVVPFYIVTLPSYDPLSVSGPKPERFSIVGIVFIFGGFALLMSLGYKRSDAAYSRYIRKTAPDSGYSIYYNGQAVSGSTLGVDRKNFDDFDIKYDEQNKIIKIMQKR